MLIIYEHILFSLNQSKYICDIVFPRTENHVRPHDFISSACENGCFRRLWYHLHLLTPSQFHKISAQERGIKHPCYTAEAIWRPNNICFRRADMQLKRFCNPFQGSSPLPISAHRSVCYGIFRLRLPLTVS